MIFFIQYYVTNHCDYVWHSAWANDDAIWDYVKHRTEFIHPTALVQPSFEEAVEEADAEVKATHPELEPLVRCLGYLTI